MYLSKHTLISINSPEEEDYHYIVENFCGKIIQTINDIDQVQPDSMLYLCGDINLIIDHIRGNNKFYIIKELSYNYNEKMPCINLGEVPINVHNVGIYFRKLFCGVDDKNYYDLISNQHNFQFLTQSNKVGESHRKGIYLSKVEKIDDQINFNLLRCSTNLSGPTDNFREVDNFILNKINNVSKQFFNSKELNHVLAQVYKNKVVTNKGKTTQKKAIIKAHSDKTKDMPKDGLITFCTFYENYENGKFINEDSHLIKINNSFDFTFKSNKQKECQSVLTKLCFKLKNTVSDSNLAKKFEVTLYPNSVFIIPLSTNRLYTHEILPSILPVEKIPTRMGYTIRCSETFATFKDNQTFINKEGSLIKLEPMGDEDRIRLKDLYYIENTTTEIVNYEGFFSSMNEGDYKEPIY
jgi:hypothetical protein